MNTANNESVSSLEHQTEEIVRRVEKDNSLFEVLDEREKIIANLHCEGKSIDEIALLLGISSYYVKRFTLRIHFKIENEIKNKK